MNWLNVVVWEWRSSKTPEPLGIWHAAWNIASSMEPHYTNLSNLNHAIRRKYVVHRQSSLSRTRHRWQVRNYSKSQYSITTVTKYPFTKRFCLQKSDKLTVQPHSTFWCELHGGTTFGCPHFFVCVNTSWNWNVFSLIWRIPRFYGRWFQVVENGSEPIGSHVSILTRAMHMFCFQS